MNGSRRGRRQGWERERETGAEERKRETGMRERKIERETGAGRERERETGEKEKKLQTQKIHGIFSCRASIRRTE